MGFNSGFKGLKENEFKNMLYTKKLFKATPDCITVHLHKKKYQLYWKSMSVDAM